MQSRRSSKRTARKNAPHPTEAPKSVAETRDHLTIPRSVQSAPTKTLKEIMLESKKRADKSLKETSKDTSKIPLFDLLQKPEKLSVNQLEGMLKTKGDEGPPGPPGHVGPAGPEGPRGPLGAEGSPGKQGSTGLRGTTGPKGPQGPPGSAGAVGKQGLPGARGPAGIGSPGLPGPPGIPGPQGKPGPPGAEGPRGQAGKAGKDGKDGKDGKTGEKGEVGPVGHEAGGILLPGATEISYSGGGKWKDVTEDGTFTLSGRKVTK